MNQKEALKIYKEYNEKLSAYRLMFSTMMYDKETIAPSSGNNYRNSKMAILMGEAYNLETSPERIEAIKTLKELDLGEVLNREIKLAYKSLESTLKFTKKEVMDFDLACNEGFDAWYKAKTKDDYKLFAKSLNKLIDLSIYRAHKRDSKKKAYDIYLDDYEEGMNMKKYDVFFKEVKKELIPLIKKINKKQDEIDDSFLYKYYPIDKQNLFTEKLLTYIGFDKSWGYLGESEHPFTDGFSKYDVRITTNYDEHNLVKSIFSVIHETGHAHFEHNVDSKYDDTYIRTSITSGMHESQSRFLENYIGKRKAFWVNLYPYLQELFPENLSNVSLDDFVKAINVAHSSLVRTEADELTYPIHILIRYEIEKDIFDGKLDTNDLSKIWNEKYEKYLGIKVPNDRDGILQDVHWSDASFGYFPTYALGSAIGAQLFRQMSKDIKVDELLTKNKFKSIIRYLKDNVQKDGDLYNYNEILLKLTHEEFNSKYYINYLKEKYSKLYNIK